MVSQKYGLASQHLLHTTLKLGLATFASKGFIFSNALFIDLG